MGARVSDSQFVLEDSTPTNAVKGLEAVAKASDKHLGTLVKSAAQPRVHACSPRSAPRRWQPAPPSEWASSGPSRRSRRRRSLCQQVGHGRQGQWGPRSTRGQIQKLAFHLQQVAGRHRQTRGVRGPVGASSTRLDHPAAGEAAHRRGGPLRADRPIPTRCHHQGLGPSLAPGGSDKVLAGGVSRMDETARKADAPGADDRRGDGLRRRRGGQGVRGRSRASSTVWVTTGPDVKEKIGAGANEVFEPLAKGAPRTCRRNSLPPTPKPSNRRPPRRGRVGGYHRARCARATGGQLVNMRDGFTGLGGVAEKFHLNLTKVTCEGSRPPSRSRVWARPRWAGGHHRWRGRHWGDGVGPQRGHRERRRLRHEAQPSSGRAYRSSTSPKRSTHRPRTWRASATSS